MNSRWVTALLLGLLLGSAVQADRATGLAYYQQGRYAAAFEELEAAAAQQSDPEAAWWVGTMYAEGKGTEKNPERAVHWLQQAANSGLAQAQGYLAQLYLTGEGVLPDEYRAYYNADLAAQKGDVPSQLLLGQLYLEGRGVEKDTGAALAWLQKAAEAQYPEAQYTLGQLLETGEGGKKDLTAALEWYTAAARGGYKAAAEALQRLGHSQGQPVVQPLSAVMAKTAPPVTTTSQKRRIALLIANQDYKGGVTPLTGPVNDVRLLEGVLQQAGFAVMTKTNLGLTDMKRELTRFLDGVDSQTVSLVYYSGHGVEIGGKNYLIPTDFEMNPNLSTSEAEELSLDIAAAYARMTAKAEGSLNITILDACRDNPFTASGKSLLAGASNLKTVGVPAGGAGRTIETFTAYAAEIGQTAEDAKNGQPNSPYALALAQHIPQVGQPLETVFRQVRAQVLEATKGKQRPATYSGLSSEFIFMPAQ